MNGAITITIKVEDVLTEDILVPALPPLNSIVDFGRRGTFKVREVRFVLEDAQMPAKVVVECVAVLSF